MKRRIVAVVALLAIIAAPAEAATDGSTDGAQVLLSKTANPADFASETVTGLDWSGPALLVPGDIVSTTVYVMTKACTQASGTATVLLTGGDLANSTDLGNELVYTAALNGVTKQVPVGSTFTIPGNSVNKLTIYAQFPFGDANATSIAESQLDTALLQVNITLSCQTEDETTYPDSVPSTDNTGNDDANQWVITQVADPTPTPSPTDTPTPTPTATPDTTDGPTSTPTSDGSGGSAGNSGSGDGWQASGTASGIVPLQGQMARTGVDIARYCIAACALALAGVALVGAARRHKEGRNA